MRGKAVDTDFWIEKYLNETQHQIKETYRYERICPATRFDFRLKMEQAQHVYRIFDFSSNFQLSEHVGNARVFPTGHLGLKLRLIIDLC
jgi:hypothetical protein